jgi:hypothetical protein
MTGMWDGGFGREIPMNWTTFVWWRSRSKPSSLTSHIPVMIITELCANGDLFDYIRKTDPPPFTAMLDF